ncbi:MAG: RNA-binding S4 domain-containing protein [Acidobacteria bacterium]|nr:RNA-binding S4 domain-containing protein [Acidobacteriota bacterium]
MRLDQFLRASRLVARRTVAQEMCEAGAVAVNDVPARSSRTVRVGDRVSLRRRDRLTSVRVLAVPVTRNVSKAEASTLYELTSDERLRDEDDAATP